VVAPEGGPVSGGSGPPPEKRILEIHLREGRPKPAVGERGGPASWERPEGAIGGVRPGFEDARWSFLYGEDTNYAPPAPAGRVPGTRQQTHKKGEFRHIQGPMMNAPVWTWEVPVYFWLGGLSSGASFVALAADVAGDEASARVLRRLAVGAVIPCAPLLIMDLGRPGRFLNMLRIFKPRSPMSMGAWCLFAFSNAGAGAVAADLLGRRREAKLLGGATAVLGTYLGSYTGALLAATAVPVWARSRLLLGPIFVCTAIGSGASASRLVLRDGPTRRAAGHVATAAMAAELAVSHLNERRLEELGEALEQGKPGRLFRAAKAATAFGLGLRAARAQGASPAFLAAALLFRFAWIEAGKASARDDEAVARAARSRTV
jgi:hypothetical protein